MKHHNFPVTDEIRLELAKHGIRRHSAVKVRRESYEGFLASIRQGGYTQLSDEQKHALAISCCMTHPDHKDKHRRIPQYWYWVAVAIGLLLLIGLSARAQGTSQIDVITFQNSSAVNIKSFAAPFKIKCSTNITCTSSGSTLTMTASGGAGGSGYSAIQNAGVAIAAEGAINFLGSFSCVDNPGNASSDCKLSASAAVSHQFVTGIDASGNYLRAQPAYSDISGTPTLAASLANASHKWLNSYDSTTGLFTQTQPAYSDISGTPTLPATLANASHKWFNSYDSTTGLFTQTQPAYSDISGTPQLPVTKTCTGTDKVSAYDSTNGLFTCSTDQTGAGGSTPTGTGFIHVTSGVQDVAAKTVDVSSSDITGVLAASAEPAHTGDVTNSVGSLALAIGAGTVTRTDLAADAVGWQFLGTNTSTASTISVTASTIRKHYQMRLTVGGYSGGGGVARFEMGNASTVDTGSNYGWAGLNLVSGTSTAPTVSGIGSGSTAQEGCPVSGSVTTAGRDVWIDIDNRGAAIKYGSIRQVGVGASAAVTPNMSEIGCTWNNTTDGIGVFQFKACSATTGACSTVNFTATTTLTVWGRDDN